jgi:ATP-dependent metalloprotease
MFPLFSLKVASVLIIIAIVVSLTQIFNIPFLRMGRGNNEIAPEDIDVTFDDVKGCDEAKQELQEIVEFLMHPVNLIKIISSLLYFTITF